MEQLGILMEREIWEQVSLFENLADAYFTNLSSAFKGSSVPGLFVLAARGSSDNVAGYLRYLIEIELERPAILAAPSVLTVYGKHILYPCKTLFVGISQSGAGPDVAEVLQTATDEGHLSIAFTNKEGSRVTQASNHCLLLQAGEERSVAATKTCSLSILASYQLARVLGANLPSPNSYLPGKDWFERCSAKAQQDGELLLESMTVFSLGRAFTYSTALESAIKLMECALVACKGYSSADFHHGPKALAGKDSCIIDYTGTAKETLNQPAAFIGPPRIPEHIPAELSPLWHLPYAQFLALEAGRGKGLNPDKPQFIQKVTETL